jgi:hypothetical protein
MMEIWLPAVLLLLVGLGLSGIVGDPISTSLLMYAGILLVVVLGVFLLPKARGRTMRHVAVYTACIGVFVVIASTQFPFRVTFRLSESALRELAARVGAGEQVSLPSRAGLFTIQKAGRKDDDSVYLWIDPDPTGPAGFVLGYTGCGYNLWSKLRLSGDWHYVSED